MEADKALEIVKKIGIADLACFDGCACGRCEVAGVEIHINCRKSSGAWQEGGRPAPIVRVHSRHLDFCVQAAAPIMDEVVRQIAGDFGAGQIATRFCSWEEDQEKKCCWCGEPRSAAEGYLCDKCQKKGDAAARYPSP